MFGLEIPDWRVRLIKGGRRVVLPYFNAGWWVLSRREILLGCGYLVSGLTRQQKVMPIRIGEKGLGSTRYHACQRLGWAGEWKFDPTYRICHPIG